ncbi:MAG TPA: hotdog domain-containing protein, partial [Solirubrobacteraceae bacterium]|nr:hotdog domain-containing protein [Solirubrobacteraceae bacterium]
GALHGSVLFKALDDAAIFAVYSVEREMFVVTTSFTTTLLRPVSAGVIEATGTVVTRSGRVRVPHSTVTCAGEIVGHGAGTFTITRIPFSSLASYGEA